MGKIAFVFAGQGAQTVGMGKDLYDRFETAKGIFDRANAVLDGITDICFNGPEEILNQTVNTQPCLFLTDLACARLLEEKGVKADGAAGFSLGEIPAAVFAGIFDEASGFDFVCHRARAMQECADENKGAMFAVLKLSAEDVISVCASAGKAYPVNFNCPGQTVVACAEESAESITKAVSDKGGRAMPLKVSGAFHSPFMDKAGESIAQYLDGKSFGEMKIPLYANATANVYDDPAGLLARQVNNPVLWQKTIENMISDGFDTFVEVGAGKTLSGLIKKIDGSVPVYNVCDFSSLEQTASALRKD